MNREQFISQLKNKLQGIPFDEAANAIAYYEEYFDEAGIQYERQVIDELGSPSDVAAKIIGDYVIRDIDKSPKSAKKGLSTIWVVILGIFASPIALPLALAAVIMALALIIVIFSVAFAFGVSGIAVAASGIVMALASASIIFTNYAAAAFYLGLSLIMFVLGSLLLILTVNIFRKSFAVLAKLMGKFLLRRGAK